LLSFVQFYTYKYLDEQAWTKFEATQALDKERQFLQAMHETLQGMLSSLFDASCTCDQSGAILSWTPQLKDLLGGHEQNLCTHLCEFAASETESGRLQHFLDQICQSKNHSAQVIQASLSAGRSQGSSSFGEPRITEVKMFGILLPDRHARYRDCRSKSIFIGLQGQVNGTSILDSHPPPLLEASTDIEAVALDKEHVEVPRVPTDSNDASERAESIHGSLSYTKGHSSEAGTHFSLVSKLSRQHQQQLQQQEQPNQPKLKCIFCEEYRNQPNQLNQPTVKNVAVQTEEEIGELTTASSNSAHAQTELKHLSKQVFQCPRCFLPQMPEIHSDVTREQRCFVTWKSEQRNWRKIKLNSSKRVLRDFNATPNSTVTVCLLQLAKNVNAPGKGCCSFHITMAKVASVLVSLRSFQCSAEFLPYNDWQCHHCKAMNESLADDDDEEEERCSTCDTKRRQWHASGSESGNQADLESDTQART